MRAHVHRLFAGALCLLAACAQLPTRPDLPPETAQPLSVGASLDRLLADFEAAHPGQSAFRLLKEGPEAFAVRARTAALAQRSLDVQTYIWRDDLTGRFLVHQLLDAADRGVRVRLLVDDMDARANNAAFGALAAHPNVSVRMFNPFASRSGFVGFMSEGLTNFDRVNHRMHNKTWIADNRVAVAGGRNLGDEYFGASNEVNFVDLDFAMIGPIVRDASASFDRYWNSPAAYPMQTLDPKSVSDAALSSLRKTLAEDASTAIESKYAQVLREDDAVRRLAAGDWPMQWTSAYAFVADDPLKATLPERDLQRSHVLSAVSAAMDEAQSRLTIISPYFVPGPEGSKGLTSAARHGRSVRILTNSLAANDVAAVHGGYSRHRQALLEGGVELWELKPLASAANEQSFLGGSGASLHTKAFALDARTLFVGSYNLDPRSTWLNCEQGVLVESAPLAHELEQIFATQTGADRAWRLQLHDASIEWSDGTERFNSDPHASLGRRFQAWIARVLHLDAQL